MESAELVDIPPELMRDDLIRRAPEGVRFKNLTGDTYGPWTAVGFAGWLRQYSVWLWRCECGELEIHRANYIRHRAPQSCQHNPAYKHELHKTWLGIIARCTQPSSCSYSRYGGRGIKICDRWRNSFFDFVADMGDRPSPKHSIDRIDNDGDYEPGNCRWATHWEQCANKSSGCLRMIEYNGVEKPMSVWAEDVGVTRERMRQRLNKLEAIGADPSFAVSTPPGETMEPLRNAKHGRNRSEDRMNVDKEWFDGGAKVMQRGEDFDCSTSAFCALLRAESAERGGRATTRQLGDFVLFQHGEKKS